MIKKFLILYFSTLLALAAQELPQMRVIGTPKLLSNEFVGTSHKDANNRIAAMVKIASDLGGLAYQANNGIISVEKLPGVDQVYLQPDERVLDVYKSGYEKLQIILSEYDVRLQSRQVWEFKVTGDKKPVNVIIQTEPKDAEKILDGESLGTGESFKIVPGEHELRIRKEAYRGTSQLITVNEDHVLFKDIVLKQIDVTAVTLTTQPTGADVYINGVLRGQSYWSDFLFPETYALKIVKPGYLDIVEDIDIKEDIQNNLNYTLTRNIAYLNIIVTPADARIMMNNQPYSAGHLELSPGEHILNVMQSGYLSQSDTVLIQPGETISKSYTLVKNTGFLTVSIQPADAELFINKSSYGQQRRVELAPGSYRIELQHPHYFILTDNIQISRGETTSKVYGLDLKSGSLQFKVLPNNASVIMNDAAGKRYEQWTGLKLMQQVPVGNYVLDVSHPDYLSAQKPFQIEYNQRTTIDMSLMTYEGSIQQEIDAQKRMRNISWIGAAALGIGSAALKAYSSQLYSDYEDAQNTQTAEDLYQQANTMHKISGDVAIGAGIVFSPSLKFQLNIQKLNKKLGR